jgi:exopolyphosphatase/pppGpp-phosphohydrolase
MSMFAAVDIGSNSVRLKIARVVRHRLEEVSAASGPSSIPSQ